MGLAWDLPGANPLADIQEAYKKMRDGYEPTPSQLDLPVRLPDMDAIIELINEGHYDDHLEDLLAAAHGRKREKRGIRVPYGRKR